MESMICAYLEGVDMIEITYYNDAIYVINNTQNSEVMSGICYDEDTTFEIMSNSRAYKPRVFWDSIAVEDYDGDETDYSFVIVEIPFGWTGKIPISDEKMQELDFKVIDDNDWLIVSEPERITLCK
jgi:hypothetical protein